MRSGFIGLDGSYYASMPAGQQGIYLKGNNTSTLSQRNTNNFSYGVELYFNL